MRTHTACPVVSGQDKACQRQGDDLYFSFSLATLTLPPPPLSLSVPPCHCGSINKWTPIFPPEWWGSHLCPSFSIFLILSFHPPKAPNVKSHLLSEPTEKGLQWLPALQPQWCGCHCDSASAVMSRWLWLTYLWSSDPTVSFQAFISSVPKTFQRPS